MPQCQFPIFCCFVFQKSCTGNILGIGRNKSRSSYFTVTKTESGGETKKHHEATTPSLGAAYPLAVPRGGVGPSGAHRPRPSAYIFTISGKPWIPEPPSTKSSVAAAIAEPISGGFWSSSRHPAGGGNHRRRHLHRHAHLRSDAWVVHPWTMGP